jgi:biotin synthase-like enzyme
LSEGAVLELTLRGGCSQFRECGFCSFQPQKPPLTIERNNMSDQEIIAEALAKDLKLMISNEIEEKLKSFLEREQSELKDLFARVKEEESERLEIMIKGIKSHTDRIKALEEFTGIKDLPFETS